MSSRHACLKRRRRRHWISFFRRCEASSPTSCKASGRSSPCTGESSRMAGIVQREEIGLRVQTGRRRERLQTTLSGTVKARRPRAVAVHRPANGESCPRCRRSHLLCVHQHRCKHNPVHQRQSKLALRFPVISLFLALAQSPPRSATRHRAHVLHQPPSKGQTVSMTVMLLRGTILYIPTGTRRIQHLRRHQNHLSYPRKHRHALLPEFLLTSNATPLLTNPSLHPHLHLQSSLMNRAHPLSSSPLRHG